MRTKLIYKGKDEHGDSIWVDESNGRGDPGRAIEKPVEEGFALGCIRTQIDEMRAFAKTSGFTDIEFVPDRDVDGWFNCKAPNADRFNKFSKACEIPVKNGQYSGKTITAAELDSARRLMRERYPIKEGV